MSIVIYENAIRDLPVDDYLLEVGQAVAQRAQAASSTPAGRYPNVSGHPWRRSGALNEGIQTATGKDEDGAFVDVGTDAISPRQGYAYPYYLEKHGFRFLTSALEDLDIPFREV